MKNAWFYEKLYPDIKIGLKIKKKIYSNRNNLQKIDIIDTANMGRVLVLDGIIQTTERDEFIYHEMLTHLPLLSHPKPEKVLVIGGGDGGILREVLKHKIKEVVLVEIDKEVIATSRRYLKKIESDSFSDPRVKVIIDDGANYVKDRENEFDVIIIDSPDPIGPAEVLFKDEFYLDVKKALKEDGIMVRQTGSTFLQNSELGDNYKRLSRIFKIIKIYLAAIPTYIGGFFSFVFASDGVDPEKLDYKNIEERYKKLKLKTKYYNPGIHFACFSLPNYVEELKG